MKQIATTHGLSVSLRTENPNLWADTLIRCPYIPVVYTNSSINFQYAYQRGHGGNWEDLSVIVYWDNKPTALWPLSFSNKDGKNVISSHGFPVLPPLFTTECPEGSRKRIIKSCLDIADMLARSAGIVSWDSAESFNDNYGLSCWHSDAMARDATCTIQHEMYLDLRQDIAAIKKNFRKSYKSLITSGMRLWSVCVLDTPDETTWNQFRELHFKVSGRKTRSEDTWAIHLHDIKIERAFLVYLLDRAGQMIGGGFFNFTRDEGLYAVAAYDRALFDKPLGHVVQYRAIEELKKRGVHWYKIGLRPYRSESPTPSGKEISIGEFKQGFASHLFPRFILRHPISIGSVIPKEGTIEK